MQEYGQTTVEPDGQTTSMESPTATAVADRPAVAPLSDRPTAELVRELSDQTTALMRKEIELAKAELAQKGKRLGIGAGMFGGAGLIGIFLLGALTAAAIMGIATAVAGWLAALIVAGGYAILAGVLALVGKTEVDRGTPPMPEQAVASTKEDLEWVKARAKSGRHS